MLTLHDKTILVFLLLLCSAFFSCEETALFSLTRVQIKRFKDSKSKFARFVLYLLKKPREILITISLGNEIVNVGIAVVIASMVYDVMGDVEWGTSTLISVAVATPVVMIFGEVLPKNAAVSAAGVIAPILAIPLRWFYILVTPLRSLLMHVAEAFVKLFGGNPKEYRSMIMEEEVRELVDMGCEEGVFMEPEGELIHAVLDFSDTRVKAVMTPMENVFRLPFDIDFDRLLLEVKDTQFSRIPIYQNEADDIVGILYVRDFIAFYKRRGGGHISDLEEIIRPAFYVELTMPLEDLLHEFQSRKIHMAIVVSDERKPVGVVTMDDVLGALFGEEGLL